mmetsp:Transcript_97827/g.232944  ORF Transcript_97827/g.232944 Transcript_97827/m.232944 type:complete len:230 (+) Transcript_97827:812-1501(+)
MQHIPTGWSGNSCGQVFSKEAPQGAKQGKPPPSQADQDVDQEGEHRGIHPGVGAQGGRRGKDHHEPGAFAEAVARQRHGAGDDVQLVPCHGEVPVLPGPPHQAVVRVPHKCQRALLYDDGRNGEVEAGPEDVPVGDQDSIRPAHINRHQWQCVAGKYVSQSPREARPETAPSVLAPCQVIERHKRAKQQRTEGNSDHEYRMQPVIIEEGCGYRGSPYRRSKQFSPQQAV